ncbi:MAG: hypothetical protein GY711_14730 [bacterium]|nr:hypothetical protein [bacterium]
MDPTALSPSAIDGVTGDRPLGGTNAMLGWPPEAGADSYAVTRVAIGSLGTDQYGTCIASGLAGASYDDPDVPAVGTGYAYLVQGENAVCGSGSLGFDGVGAERFNADANGCP